MEEGYLLSDKVIVQCIDRGMTVPPSSPLSGAQTAIKHLYRTPNP